MPSANSVDVPGETGESVVRDTRAGATAALVFALGLGLASLAVPLVAVRAGYSAAQIGLLIALSAIGQIATRVCMGPLLRRVPDRTFVVYAGVILAVSNGLLAVSAAWVPFALSQLLQGVARAFFWTGSQTHAVRMSHSAVNALTRINLASGVGQVVGPLLAGLLAARSDRLAMAIGAILAAVAVVPSALLVRLPTFEQRTSQSQAERLWRRPGINAACWAGAAAGAWRGLVGSYVPVVLDAARQSSATIGALAAVGNAASLAGTALSPYLSRLGHRRALFLSVVATGLGVAVVGPFAGLAVVAGCALALSGVGAGTLQTIGPAAASNAVPPQERGEALATTGTFRATALLLAPFGAAGLVLVLPVGAAVAVAGVLVALPAVTLPSLRPRRAPRTSRSAAALLSRPTDDDAGAPDPATPVRRKCP